MWRALFLALGIYTAMLGLQGLAVEKAILADVNNPFTARRAEKRTVSLANREVTPEQWVPWSLLSGGAVLLLYAITLPRRNSG